MASEWQFSLECKLKISKIHNEKDYPNFLLEKHKMDDELHYQVTFLI